eukprot:jgi/Chrpa1/4136/Chrysochromulina_OHIO_Genome00011845-RA
MSHSCGLVKCRVVHPLGLLELAHRRVARPVEPEGHQDAPSCTGFGALPCCAVSRCICNDSASSAAARDDASMVAFCLATFLTRLARPAKRRDESVSVTSALAGEMHTTRLVLQFPPNDSCRIRVSTESRKGTCEFSPCLLLVSAAITLPRASSDVLIFCASASEIPTAPERPTSSEPARSQSVSTALVVRLQLGRRAAAVRSRIQEQVEDAVEVDLEVLHAHMEAAHGAGMLTGEELADHAVRNSLGLGANLRELANRECLARARLPIREERSVVALANGLDEGLPHQLHERRVVLALEDVAERKGRTRTPTRMRSSLVVKATGAKPPVLFWCESLRLLVKPRRLRWMSVAASGSGVEMLASRSSSDASLELATKLDEVGKPTKSDDEVGKPPKSDEEVGMTSKSDEEVGTTPKSDGEVGMTPKSDEEVGMTPKSDDEVGMTSKSGMLPKSEAPKSWTARNGEAFLDGIPEESAAPKSAAPKSVAPKSELGNGKALKACPKSVAPSAP